MKKPTLTGKGNLDTLILIAAVAALFFIFKGIQGILEKTNIIPDEEERKAKETVTRQTGEEKKPVKVTAPGFTEVTQPGGAFNPSYYKTLIKNTKALAAEKGLKGDVILTTTGGLKTSAKNIYDSVRTPLAVPNPIYWSDNPQQGIAQFKKYRYKAQISQLAEVFNQEYKKDLYFWLKDKYDTQDQKEALATIIEYVNNLPSGGYIYPKNKSINELTIRK
jgi:hypothetical protein